MIGRTEVLAFVTEHPGATATEIARGLGLPGYRVYTALETLYGRRRVERQPASKSIEDNRPYRWYPAAYTARPPTTPAMGAPTRADGS